MKNIKIAALAALLSVSLPSLAQVRGVNDPVIMTINNKPVLRSEFAYSYKKNNGEDVIERKTVDEYVDLFVNYKLKVEAALDAKCDTMTSYKKDFRKYRDMQVLPTLIVDADMEREAQNIYANTKERIGADGLVNPQHILIRVSQNADASAQNAARQRADSIYQAVLGGASFDDLAKRCSEDPGSAQRGGEVGFISKGQTLKAFEETAFSLQPGQMAPPVLSEVGYHIIRMKERKQLDPYEVLKKDIYNFIERQNVRESMAKNRLKEIAAATATTEEQVMDMRADSLANLSQDMKYLIKDYHDGLLVFEISDLEVWKKAEKDEAGLQAFFKKNKKKYQWDEPRFKGISYFTRDISDIDAVKKSLKGKKFNEWAQILRSTFNNDSVLRIRVEKGVFKKGANGLVDREEFGIADAKVKKLKGFDYTATYGKMLKAPEELDDVRSLVLADYQEVMEQEWIKRLKARYPVSVNFDIVDTVK